MSEPDMERRILLRRAVARREENVEPHRRDFLYVATAAVGAVGTGLTIWPFIANLNPSADVLSFSTVEADLTPIDLGQRITVNWRGNPVFISHRTEAEIARARSDDSSPDLIDPEKDEQRVQRPEWLILVGVCTHLGCIPLGQKSDEPRGAHEGWFCPCHGSVYDASGRVRRGPAPRNMEVPSYKFLTDARVMIG
jgi:ubiquinol-cytochrome c reductase iron-sulfur subunit